ncbi:glycosyltransferase [Winogradskyella sp. PG-2]|uniref:glycosyltransferase n=1 Tax=Winogradskyella sp. PG-2 TaxID=754409 RepID=UPI0004588FFD|nr:glycosyltransferase [Winogradskyella sp. PG-2]BAO75969.1 N-acetylglucosaminyltransferase [Winogradskyella sp. PG-2]
METIIQIFQYLGQGTEMIFAVYFAVSTLYVLVFASAGHFYKKRKQNTDDKLSKMAIFIPAYKEDAVIVGVAKKALLQQYPPSFYDVIVIADSLQSKTLIELQKLPIKVVKVSFENSTKAKALNAAIQDSDKDYDYAIILDADNIMESHFLMKMNTAFQNGFRVVQAHRKAKNQNTSFAILDAASEEINNHIYRRGHRALGLSSGLIGSGMGFDYKIFESIMKKITAIGGFDKELEFKLAQKNISIEYLQDTVVLDEKVQKSTDFSKQRRRWLATQFVYLKRYYKSGLRALFSSGNVNLFDKVFQMIVPPRILLLGITIITALVYCLLDFGLNIKTYVSSFVWVVNLTLLVVAFVLALPRSFYNTATLKAMASMPSAFLRMFCLLFNLKGANTKFIHTSHGVIKR